MRISEKEKNYIAWQNRSFRFYISSRLLHFNDLVGPSVFCAQQSLELLLKATLTYWNKSFKPEIAGHKFAKMLRTLQNKVKNAKNVTIPSYFYSDKRYQTVSRYPTKGKGILKPATFLEDLDKNFKELVTLVPFQFNSELIHALDGSDKNRLKILRRKNKEIRSLRKFLKINSS